LVRLRQKTQVSRNFGTPSILNEKVANIKTKFMRHFVLNLVLDEEIDEQTLIMAKAVLEKLKKANS